MLYIVDRDTEKILAKWDAWYAHAFEEATEFIVKENLEFLDLEITLMGDMVLWVR